MLYRDRTLGWAVHTQEGRMADGSNQVSIL